MQAFIEGFNVPDAIQVYQALKKGEVEMSTELKQSLLELICFYNEEEAPEDKDNEIKEAAFFELIKWKDGKVAEEIYSDINPITDEARLALLLGMAKHHQRKRGWQIHLECQANNVKYTTDAFNAALRCIDAEDDVGIVWTNVMVLLKNMKEQKCSPNNETLIAALRCFLVTKTKDYTKSCELALDLWKEFTSIGIQPSLGAYGSLANVFRMRPQRNEILEAIMDEIETKQFSLEHKDDLEFFSFVMTFATGLKDMEMGYRINDYVETGDNNIFLGGLSQTHKYYRNFLYLVLEQEPIDRTMAMLDKYTPHVFNPTLSHYAKVLEVIEMQQRFKHLPKLWIDCQLSQFCDSTKIARMEMTRKFLDIALACDTKISEWSYLQESFLNMAREALEDVCRAPTRRDIPLQDNKAAATICDQVIRIALRSDDFSLATKTMRFIYDEITVIPDHISEQTVEEYVDTAIRNQMKSEAMTGLMYAVELSLSNSDTIGLKLARSFQLEDIEKKQINQYFAHDSQWQLL